MCSALIAERAEDEMRNNTTLPRIAKATSPSYPDRLAVVFVDDLMLTYAFDSTAERDEGIESAFTLGDAEPVHLHCRTRGCPCTFPTLILEEDPRPAPRLRSDRPRSLPRRTGRTPRRVTAMRRVR
jgi:hypothetical protein